MLLWYFGRGSRLLNVFHVARYLSLYTNKRWLQTVSCVQEQVAAFTICFEIIMTYYCWLMFIMWMVTFSPKMYKCVCFPISYDHTYLLSDFLLSHISAFWFPMITQICFLISYDHTYLVSDFLWSHRSAFRFPIITHIYVLNDSGMWFS